ncbi:hypothetical protein Bca52824_042997 [Brassica carinata]|uniref:Uncharacterized protein n=1 Tax=Brassica carinata TaxID=52824 RepID=A0A8X7RZE1_BRACI|nr:hypothetical protein Bca52824_042997 [Brassica carinata]
MDDEKKKKRNKKKKNKQNNSKRADGDAIPTEDGNHTGDADIAQINQVPDSIQLEPSSQQMIINADEPGVVDYTSPNSEAVLEETIKQLRDEIGSHLQKVAVFEETVRRLETENEAHIQKEAFLEERLEHLRTQDEAHIQKQALLEERLEHLRTENEAHIEKEAQLEKTVAHLRTQNEAHIEKEGLLEERLEHLKTENEARIQSEALLEERLLHLRTENEAYIQKEAQLEERLLHLRTENETLKQNEEKLEERLVQYKTKNDVLVHEMSSTEVKMRQLLDEKSTFSQKEASLEKKIQQLQHDEESSVAAAEKSSIEMISSLNNEIGTLRAQVMKLEESRSNLQEQNNSLVETVSSLQVQRENHDNNVKGASEEELNSQIEAACTLVEKLITENAELVEKVNELCIQLNQSQRAFASPPESLSIEVQKSDALEEIPIHDEMIRIDDSGDMETALVERNLTEETVPVSVNPNGEIDVESQVAVAGEAEEVSGGVPLVDAPLIGAPFRLVSFVARYNSKETMRKEFQTKVLQPSELRCIMETANSMIVNHNYKKDMVVLDLEHSSTSCNTAAAAMASSVTDGLTALLDKRLLHLRTENEALKLNEVRKLEKRLVQFKTKNDVLVHEMSSTEVKMRQLLDERSTFSQKEARLAKNLHHDEKSSVAAAEVMKLEDSRSNLQEQNKSLVETVSNLQVQRENHESNVKGASEEELNSQIEAACTLVEKLITENAELVEKVNELCIQLNQSQHAFASTPESLAIEVQKSDTLEEIPIHDELIRTDDSGDIETAPLDRNLSGEEEEASGGVPLVDAPLIGAPFRLVSFVARYVSGADLAEKKQLL